MATRIVATRGVQEYRATIPALLTERDIVLELGCEWGTTTALLAERVHHVLGTDISPKCIDRARKMHPELEFAALDAFDVMAIGELPCRFTAIYLDLSGFSGYRALLDLIALLRMYETVLQPELVVVKSGALKRFLERCSAWPAG